MQAVVAWFLCRAWGEQHGGHFEQVHGLAASHMVSGVKSCSLMNRTTWREGPDSRQWCQES